MSTAGVILYGPPASGKDTVTAALTRHDRRFALFPRIKCGNGRRDGYRTVDRHALDDLRAAGEVVWSNEQYGSTYVVDRSELTDRLARGIPVVHLGQVAAIEAVTAATPATTWLVIGLWCAREVAAERMAQRGSTDIARRLAVWDATPSLGPPACTLNTGLIRPQHVAQLIAATVLDLAPTPR